jgi:hypothetical protein
MIMVDAFIATPKIDIFVQEDMIFIMNRTKAGWKSWFTEPLPNIGLFLCRYDNAIYRYTIITYRIFLRILLLLLFVLTIY